MLAMAKGGMSLREYARTRGVAQRAIQQQVEAGTIRLVNGRVDPMQADNSWGLIRRASPLGQHQNDDAGRRSARAKIAVAVARLRLFRERYDRARDRYVDRAEAIEVARSEADYVLDALSAAPAARVEAFAAELAIEPVVARRILDRFVSLALSEIGDLRRQAVRDAERA
jgi:hypothetical protein